MGVRGMPVNMNRTLGGTFFMICRIKDAEIYYEIIGEGKPVIIIHGCAPDHRLMQRCMESVFEKYKGYQRIYIDLPGMGNRMLQIG